MSEPGPSPTNQRQRRRVFAAVASIGLPRPAEREMREQIENPPEPYRGSGGPADSWAMRIYAVVFALAVIGIVAFVVIATR
jgi:hypothetical protein